jgi:hypothetical protein
MKNQLAVIIIAIVVLLAGLIVYLNSRALIPYPIAISICLFLLLLIASLHLRHWIRVFLILPLSI